MIVLIKIAIEIFDFEEIVFHIFNRWIIHMVLSFSREYVTNLLFMRLIITLR